MCLISNKIKLCSCSKGSIEELKNYWILYRYNDDKDEICLGESILPTSMLDFNFNENLEALVSRLNEVDTFDIPLEFQPKDILEVVINNNSRTHDPSHYTFKYNNGKWETTENDPFEIMNHYDEKVTGKIKNALKRN